MYYLFTLTRDINAKGIECLVGDSPVIPIIGFREMGDVSKVVFRIDDRVVKYILKSSGGVSAKQRFNEVGVLRWKRNSDGRDFLIGEINRVPVIVYGKKDDVDKFNVYVDEKILFELSKKQKEAAAERKKTAVRQEDAASNSQAKG